jgi:aminocarboxymuconate-semialdehyde decarboxylase
VLPLPDIDGSLGQIAYALDVLELDGVSIFTNAGGSYLGDGRFDEIFAELQRRSAVVFVHPAASPDPIAHTLGLPDALLDYPFDTSRAVAKLHYSNTFARTPDIKYVFVYAGGTIPFVASRFAIIDQITPGRRSEGRSLTRCTACIGTPPRRSAIRCFTCCER